MALSLHSDEQGWAFPRFYERGSIEADFIDVDDVHLKWFPRFYERGSIEAMSAPVNSGVRWLRFHVSMNVAQLKPRLTTEARHLVKGFHVSMNVAQLKQHSAQQL